MVTMERDAIHPGAHPFHSEGRSILSRILTMDLAAERVPAQMDLISNGSKELHESCLRRGFGARAQVERNRQRAWPAASQQ
jgi:hypothetical protein